MQLFSWLLERMNARSQTRRTPARKPTLGVRPRLEMLEGRVVPAVGSPVVLSSPQTVALITGDINGDGHPDLISASNNGRSINVRLNNGNGTFGGGGDYSNGWSQFGAVTALAVGNFKGQPSIFVASYAAGNGTGGYSNLSVLQLKSNGFLSDVGDRPLIPGIGGPMISSLAVADLYGDGETDLVAAPANGGHVYVERINSAGSFGSPQSYQIWATTPTFGREQLAVGDLNGDGKPDVVATAPAQNNVSVLLNNGSGTFGAVRNFQVGGRPSAVAVGDMNLDGKPDIVTTNSNGTVSVLSGNGDGTFFAHNYGAPQSVPVVPPHVSLALADLGHDGALDIVTESSVFFNAGTGYYPYRRLTPGTGVVAADFNGDGYADLAEIVESTSSIDVLLDDAQW